MYIQKPTSPRKLPSVREGSSWEAQEQTPGFPGSQQPAFWTAVTTAFFEATGILPRHWLIRQAGQPQISRMYLSNSLCCHTDLSVPWRVTCSLLLSSRALLHHHRLQPQAIKQEFSSLFFLPCHRCLWGRQCSPVP